jgi:hypothetical protein
MVDQGGTGRERKPQMSQMPKTRPPIFGKPSTISAPPQPAPFATEALQEEWKAAAEARIRATEEANLKNLPRPDEIPSGRD